MYASTNFYFQLVIMYKSKKIKVRNIWNIVKNIQIKGWFQYIFIIKFIIWQEGEWRCLLKALGDKIKRYNCNQKAIK